MIHMKKQTRALLYLGIVLSSLSIFCVIMSYMVQYNTGMLYPIVLPIMLLVFALTKLKQLK